jgi:FdhD protein
MSRRTQAVPVLHLDGGVLSERREQLCVESPLQILVKLGPDAEPQPLTITMRTPAASKLQRDEDDADLSLGFLLGEGIVRSPQQVLAVDSPPGEDRVVVTLRDDVQLPQRQLARSFVSTSACGVCGKSTLDGLAAEPSEPLRPGWPLLSVQALPRLPEQLLAAQATFAHTGGLHAAALFDSSLRLLALREDVGRHNAVDKLIGSQLRLGTVPLHGHLLLVSGRASFELVQKARMAALAVFVAIGAPSSLALQVAREAGMTLVGFLRGTRMNVYCGAERLRDGDGPLVHDDDDDGDDDNESIGGSPEDGKEFSECQVKSAPAVGRRLPMIPAK